MPKKIKSGRTLAVDMLNLCSEYAKKKVDGDWLDGMVLAWTKKLVQSSSSKSDGARNSKELHVSTKKLIAKRMNNPADAARLVMLHESCLTFNLFTKTMDMEAKLNNG
jgi:hypothetical protein